MEKCCVKLGKMVLCSILSAQFLFSGVQVFSADNSQIKTQVKTSSISKLSDEELKKCELSGINKKDWAQRLQWLESKIIDKYKSFNAKNILVVGEQKFLDAFKQAAQRHDWQANFEYATSANSIEIKQEGGQDLVIDSLYKSTCLKRIYGNLKVSQFISIYRTILVDTTLSFLKENGVDYYFFESPKLSKAKNIDELEQRWIREPLSWLEIKGDKDLATKFFKDEYINFNIPGIYYNGKYNILKDFKTPCKSVINGVRVTTDVPRTFKNSIYFLGPCYIAGNITNDESTMESHLQRLINKNYKDLYRVVNYGVHGGPDVINDFERLLDTPLKKGDIVIQILPTMDYKKVKEYGFETNDSLSSLFDRPHDYGYWSKDNYSHMTPTAFKVIANYIYDIIKPKLNNDKSTESAEPVKYQFENEVDTFLDNNPDLKNYLDHLKSIKEENNINGKVGSIVMNCNPFTLGHRYLIEQAVSQVDHLYIFVVEEDKSVFSFKDRMDLVKKGTADLGDKITVLPSGKRIISLLTFPEYFSKDDKQEDIIDPSNDVRLFGKYICPALGINKRFVGEEPFDLVTRQYNDTMRRELPLLNIDFQEIPRKSIEGNDVISATKVRKALKANDFETLKKYVPQTTLNYLKENYEEIVKAINSKYDY